MATSEILIPDSLISTVNILLPALSEIQTDDTEWFDSTTHALDTEFRVGLPTPSRALSTVINQVTNIVVRKSRTTSFNPTVRIEIWENGAGAAYVVGPEISVTSTTSQSESLSWSSSGLTDLTGAIVEIRVVGTRAGEAEVGDWVAVEYNYCEWVAELDPAIPTAQIVLTGYVPLAGINHFPVPAKAAAALTGQAVVSKYDRFLDPAAATPVLTGAAPLLSFTLQAVPLVSLNFAGKAATILVNHITLPAVYAVVLTGAAPTLLHNSIRTPAEVTSFALSGKTPTLDLTEDHIINPGAPNFTLKPKIVSKSPPKEISSSEGTLVLAGQAPTFINTLNVWKSPPSVTSFALGAQSVVRISDRPRTPAVDVFMLLGQSVGRSTSNVVPIPDAAALSFSSAEPALFSEFTTLALAGQTVITTVNDIVAPAAAALALSSNTFFIGQSTTFALGGTLSLQGNGVTFVIEAPSMTDDLRLVSLTIVRKAFSIATPARIS